MKNKTLRSAYERKFDPLNNFFFYKIFREKGNEIQLMSFINAVLDKSGNNKIVSVEIQENTSFMAEILGGKSCILDVRAKLPNGSLVNIEVQIRNKHNIDRRSLFYFSKVYTSKLKSGYDYIELPNVIAINIVDFDFPPTQSYHSCFHLCEDTERDIILTDAIEVHFINMVRYKKQLNDKSNEQFLNDPLCRWLAWFDKDSPTELLQEVIKMDSTIQTADDRMEHITQSEEEMWAYTRHLMAQCDRTAELNYGISKIREEIAQNLLSKGSTLEFVQEITGLDMETIQKLV